MKGLRSKRGRGDKKKNQKWEDRENTFRKKETQKKDKKRREMGRRR